MTATVDINPADAIARNARLKPGEVAIRYGSDELTNAALNHQVARLAATLSGGGVHPGDRVAFLGMNSPAFLVTMLSAWRIGAIFVPVNYRLAAPELQQVITRSGVVAIVSEPSFCQLVDDAGPHTQLSQFLYVDDDPHLLDDAAPESGWESYSEKTVLAAGEVESVPAGFDDPALVMFTSGTTGAPKGVVLTHGNLWWNALNVDSRIDTRRDDVTYAVAPLFHIGALNSFVIRTLVRGGTVLVRRTFDPQLFIEDLRTHRVCSLFAVPVMLDAVSRISEFATTDLSHVRAIVVAGAPVSPHLIRLFAERGIWLQQAWGLTETAPFATHLPVEWTLEKLGSAGIAMPYTEIRVVDILTNRPTDANGLGEIVVRGPNVTPGYWEDPVATAAAFDDDRWFHSGDIGYLDDDGFLFVVDRLKDMVISGGENVYPAEVERVLCRMPGVKDVAVVGMADDRWGEAVVAVVSMHEDSAPITLDQLRVFAGGHLARYKLPLRVCVVEHLRRNAAGKLLKDEIRAHVATLGQHVVIEDR